MYQLILVQSEPEQVPHTFYTTTLQALSLPRILKRRGILCKAYVTHLRQSHEGMAHAIVQDFYGAVEVSTRHEMRLQQLADL
jgi:hypothetical protein